MSNLLGNPHEVLERVKSRIEIVNECWEWQGHIGADGYGRLSVSGKQSLAHRASYSASVGQIPEGLNIDHLCRNRRCVNPAHLEPVTQSENLLRSPLMGRQSEVTHCPKGHPYNDTNTEHRNGRRHCKTCNRARWDVDKHNPVSTCPDCGRSMRRGNIKRHQSESCKARFRLGSNND